MVGRPKTVFTPEEEAARKRERTKKYFGPEYNAKRRERYHSDPEYRERAKSRARVSAKKPLEKDMRNNIPLIRQFGQKRHVKYPLGDGMQLCLTFEELAKAMYKNVFSLYRWRKEGKFPDGVMTFIEPEGYQVTQAFSPEECEVILKVIGNHLAESAYYLDRHEDVKHKLFAKIDKVRRKKGLIS